VARACQGFTGDSPALREAQTFLESCSIGKT
jgi:hypothetical protein